jgi:flagellin-like protein
MGKGSCRKGLSPVIASILLILLVVVLAAMIFLWARGFISEQIEKFGQPVDTLCASTEFDVEIYNDDSSYVMEVVNRGNVGLFQLDIKKVKGGDSEYGKFKFSVDAGDSKSHEVNLDMEDGSKPDEVIIYPALVGTVVGKSTNKVFTCLEQGKTIVL